MTDCSSIQGSTSSSSDVISSRSGCGGSTGGGGSGSNGGANSRIRIIRMIRPNSRKILVGPDNNVAFGFAIRGGKEFGTGFFVSRVEKGSEADAKGLKVGDQIIRVNGYHVDDAVHKELTQFISSQDRLTIKVKGVGMLPIKEKNADPLTWHIVPQHTLTTLSGLDEFISKDVRIVLKVAPKTKLGLGICKGPEWKPGIFVQFTKEFSVARNAGLRPGDQILSCNSIDFSDVLFSEAVAVMKSAQTLEMIIRTGAGLDLFPGESSGYNSSASSVTGDQSPCWADQTAKRLSMVKEETSRIWSDRNSLDRRKSLSIQSSINGHGEKFNGQSIENENSNNNSNSNNNKTIIQLSESGTMINNTLIPNSNNPYQHLQSGLDNNIVNNNNNNNTLRRKNSDNSSSSIFNCNNNNSNNNVAQLQQQSPNSGNNKMSGKIADICFVSRQSETKTVIVEVHRSAAEENRSTLSPSSTTALTTNAPLPPPKPPTPGTLDGHERSPSMCSGSTSSSFGASSSLSSAISEELKKRQERRTNVASNNGNNQSSAPMNSDQQQQPRQQPPKRIGNPSLGGNGDERRHNALMDEFKRAHRKMFKNGFQEDEKNERKEELSKATVMRDEVDNRAMTNGHASNKSENITQFPTPPPPPQFANSPPKENTIEEGNKLNQRKLLFDPPATPTPDYDSTPSNTLQKNHNGVYRNGMSTILNGNSNGMINGKLNSTLGRIVTCEAAKANGSSAELKSIDSYKLQNPSSTSIPPRPPSLYFASQNSGPPTMKKSVRPVSVTIGEYGANLNGGGRKEPSKFDFIKTNLENKHNGNVTPSPTSPITNGNSKDDNGSVSEMLRSELEKTLSRSNLKKRNENNVNSYMNGQNGHQESTKQLSNGQLLNGGNNIKPILQKTPSPNIEKLANMLQNKQNNYEMNNNSNKSGTLLSSNKVTINIPNKTELKKTESNPSTPTNGILKNGFNKTNGCVEKSITFGN